MEGKPYELADLIPRIRSILAKWRMRRWALGVRGPAARPAKP